MLSQVLTPGSTSELSPLGLAAFGLLLGIREQDSHHLQLCPHPRFSLFQELGESPYQLQCGGGQEKNERSPYTPIF